MVKFILTFILTLNLSSQLMAQRKNLVSYTNYQYHEFDENPVIQNTITDAFANFSRYYDYSPEKKFPFYFIGLVKSINISYQRIINKNSSLRLTVNIRYAYDKSATTIIKKPGQCQVTRFSGLSLDYSYNIWRTTNEKFWINSFVGTKGRYGSSQVYSGNRFPVSNSPWIDLRDLGVKVGTNITYYAPFNIVINSEIGYGRWLYLKYNNKDNPSNTWGLPRNSFDMRVSIGYTFGKKVKSLQEEANEALEKKSD